MRLTIFIFGLMMIYCIKLYWCLLRDIYKDEVIFLMKSKKIKAKVIKRTKSRWDGDCYELEIEENNKIKKITVINLGPSKYNFGRRRNFPHREGKIIRIRKHEKIYKLNYSVSTMYIFILYVFFQYNVIIM